MPKHRFFWRPKGSSQSLVPVFFCDQRTDGGRNKAILGVGLSILAKQGNMSLLFSISMNIQYEIFLSRRKYILTKKSQYPNYVCTFMIILSQSLLYRCPPGYLFSTVIVRCAKQEEVSCPLDQPSEADFRYKQFVQRPSLGQITCKYFSGESTPSS